MALYTIIRVYEIPAENRVSRLRKECWRHLTCGLSVTSMFAIIFASRAKRWARVDLSILGQPAG